MTREQHEPTSPDPRALDETTVGPQAPRGPTTLTTSAVAADTELLRAPPPRPRTAGAVADDTELLRAPPPPPRTTGAAADDTELLRAPPPRSRTAGAVAADTELLRAPPPRPRTTGAAADDTELLRVPPPRPPVDLDATRAPGASSRVFERTEDGTGRRTDETQLGGPFGDSEATQIRADMSFSVGAEATAAALQAVLASGRIGRFVVLRELGRGAMGVVFAAYDEELDRKVAIKLLHASRGHEASHGRAMLLREAQAMARLAHPNVVAVHEVGLVEGAVFVAMEYVAGVDLHAWLADKQRPWREVVAALRQAGAGLVAAHREGLIHRDFKPSNVLVGDDGRVRVADFGLAARRGAPRERAGVAVVTVAPMTATLAPEGALIGTPAYMAPELLRGGSATAASDQFAYCVALYEALYGARPFDGDTLANLTEAVERRPLPAAPPREGVPAWLHAAVCRGLAKAPEQRFPALDELVELLARDPAAEQAQRRKRALQFAAAVAGTAALVALVVFAYGAISRFAAERQAERRLDVLRGQIAELRGRGEDDEARRLLRSFVELPENRGLPVIARAYLEWAAAQTEHPAAVDAYASAYVAARTDADVHAALRGLVDRLYADGQVVEAAAALAVLDRAAPEEAAAPELQPVRLAAALARLDLPAARDVLALDDPHGWSPVLEHLSKVTEFADDHVGGPPVRGRIEFAALDVDLDGVTEVVAWPQPGDLRVLRADASLTPVRAVPLGEPRHVVPLAAVVPGESLVLANYPTDKPQLYELRLYASTGDGPPRLIDAWLDSAVFSGLTVDLDGDGAREVYLGTEAYTRKLWRLDRAADGTWTRRPAHPPTDAAGSDLSAVLTADFARDGRPELVVAAGPWKAYDLRVYAPTAGGGLDQTARRAFGAFKTVTTLRRRDGDLIAFLKTDFQVAPDRFPPDKPFGEPSGVYVVGPQDGTLAVHAHLPDRPDRPEGGRPQRLSYFHAGDLDGDGDDELAIESDHDTLLLRYRPGEPLHPLRLSGVRPLLLHDLDGDGRAELLVKARDRPGVLLLGAGDTPLPPLPPSDQGPRPIPPGIPDPAIAQAWRHAEQLAAIGLPARTAAELSAIARLSGQVAPDMLFRAAELYGGLGDDAAAAEHFVAAATRPDLADPALAAAAAAHRRLGEFGPAAELTRRRLDTVAPAARPAVEAELAELTAATAERPQFAADFTRPLDPRWRIADPVAVKRDLGRRELSVWTSAATVLAELPLAWDGGPATLEVELLGDLVEWGAEIAVALVGPDDRSWLSVRLGGVGVSDKPRAELSAWDSPNNPLIIFPGTAPARARIEVYPALQTAILEATSDKSRDRIVRPIDPTMLPPPGPLRLQIRGRLIQPGYVAHASIASLRLSGFTVAGTPTGAADPAHALAEGQLTDVLAALGEPAPGSERQLWRIDALLGLGRVDAAAREIAALLAVDADFGPAYVALAQRLRRGDDAATMAARAAFGPRLVDLYLEPRMTVSLRPGDIAPVLAGLPKADPAAAPADPQARQRLVLTELARGGALAHVGRFAAAQQAFDAALARLDADPDLPLRDVLLGRVLREQLITATATADRDAALKWIDRTLAASPTPYLALDRMQADPALTRLVGPATWTALIARLRAERP